MKTEHLHRIARAVRPLMRRRIPVLYGIGKAVIKSLCSGREGDEAYCVVTDYTGGRMRVRTDSALERHVLFYGEYEPYIAAIIEDTLRPGDTCLDIGANVGAHGLLMAKLAGATGRVVAVEPHPVMAARLRENADLNGYTQMTVIEAAVDERDGTADFYGFSEASDKKGISSLLPDERATDKMEVRVLSGQTLLRETGIAECRLVKIDVEGVESIVLKGLEPLIAASRPVIIFEYRKEHWDKFHHDLDQAVKGLQAKGYRVEYVYRRKPYPYAAPAPASCEIIARTP